MYSAFSTLKSALVLEVLGMLVVDYNEESI